MDLDNAQVLWTLGLLPQEQLPAIACELLEAGQDTDSLRVLAGLSGDQVAEAAPLFRRVLQQLGKANISKEQAMRQLARIVSQQIVDGSIDAYAGAKKLSDATIRASLLDFHEVDPFIYAASEYEDRPADRQFFEEEILKEAKRWLMERGNDHEPHENGDR